VPYRPLSSNLDYVVEHDDERWRGFQVRVPGNPTKLFSYGRFGSRARAQAAAIAHRDVLCAKTDLSSKSPRLHHHQKNNRSGVVGVFRIVVRRRKRQYPVWVAMWQDLPGHTRKRWFGIPRYGSAKAKALAIAARAEGLKARGF